MLAALGVGLFGLIFSWSVILLLVSFMPDKSEKDSKWTQYAMIWTLLLLQLIGFFNIIIVHAKLDTIHAYQQHYHQNQE